MCGIGGILFSADRQEVLRQKIVRLGDSQQHRGPDGRSEIVWEQHALCHQRLAMLDVNGGSQPFRDTTGRYVIVYNGEIYNYLELRVQLEGQYTFTTACDTEVVLAAWIIWGERCLDRFNGMFAFLVWDTQTETAFAARDPMGVKPFVYCRQHQSFLFASEIKALLAVMDSHPALNEYALAEYIIAPYLSGDHLGIHKEIYYLQPGTYMHISRHRVTTHTWYRFQWTQNQLHETALTEQVAEALQQSVTTSMRADVPIGVFLSGGLDSSLIAAIAAEHAEWGPEAYTITFGAHDTINFDPATIVNADDRPYASQLAGLLHLPYQEVVARHTSWQESLQLLARINDRIPAWEQEFAQHFLSRAAADSVKAVLVGDAADETNYGYFFLLKDTVNKSPLGLLNLFGAEKRLSMLAPHLRQQLKPLTYLDEQYRVLAAAAGYDFNGGGEESILAMSTLVQQRWLQRLLHNGDIHTMHFGLEARVPFANRNVLDQVSQVYPHQGFKNGQEKYIVRQAAATWLGRHFYNRKKSALPRDPRPGKTYQAILHSLLQGKNEFVAACLDRAALEALCTQEVVVENDRMLLFNMISLIYWAQEYAK